MRLRTPEETDFPFHTELLLLNVTQIEAIVAGQTAKQFFRHSKSTVIFQDVQFAVVLLISQIFNQQRFYRTMIKKGL